MLLKLKNIAIKTKTIIESLILSQKLININFEGPLTKNSAVSNR